MKMNIFLIQIALFCISCSSFNEKPYSTEFPDKTDLVVDRVKLMNQIHKGAVFVDLKFLPVEIALEQNESSKELNVNFQNTVTSICGHTRKDLSNKKIYSDEELIQEVEIALTKAPPELKSNFLSRARSDEGKTLLLCSAMYDRTILIEFLLKQKADKNVLSYEGESPLVYARAVASVRTQEILSSNNIDAFSSIHSRYCSNELNKRNMTERIKAVLPTPPQGSSLDEAQLIIQNWKTQARKFAGEVFVIERPIDLKTRRFLGLSDSNEVLNKGSLEERYGFGKIRYESTEKLLTPLITELHSWIDLDYLRQTYTFKFSKEYQSKYFKVEKITDPYKVNFYCNGGPDFQNKFYDNDGFIGLSRNCEFSPGQAIVDRKRAWFNYAHKFTTVKEAVGHNPNEIKFEVTLDLENFCKYGVAIEDLKSK